VSLKIEWYFIIGRLDIFGLAFSEAEKKRKRIREICENGFLAVKLQCLIFNFWLLKGGGFAGLICENVFLAVKFQWLILCFL